MELDIFFKTKKEKEGKKKHIIRDHENILSNMWILIFEGR
jgi:hypothetical protein